MPSISLQKDARASIDRDHNSGIYYLSLEYKKEKELPIELGEVIEPENVLQIVEDYLVENQISYSPNKIKNRIAILLRQVIRESGVEDVKTLDAKILKWQRKKRK